MSGTLLLLATLAGSAGTSTAGPPPGSAAPPPVQDAYDAALAERDVVAILGEPNKAYLQARGRLVAHPERGVAALVARLDAVPPPDASERKRLFDVLAEIGGPQVATRIAAELRHACAAEKSESGEFAAIEQWRPLLRDLGADGRAALAELVGDKDLPVAVRAVLLDDLVTITADDAVPELLVLAGRGHVELRRQLSRSLRRRLRGERELQATVLAALDTELESADAARLTAVIQLRSAIGGGIDDAFIGKLAALAKDGARPFAVRVAAVRALATTAENAAMSGAQITALAAVATASLPAKTQAQEILASIALPALPQDQARTLAKAHALDKSPSPRLASIGWSHVDVRGEAWLGPALEDPWPQVRVAALGRVGEPCSRKLVTQVAGLVGKTASGDRDATVQRAAIDALGRCGDDASFTALRGMLDDDAVALELSGEAARELVRYFAERGADAVAKMLASRPDRGYARRLAQALRHAEAPTEKVRAVLCAWVQEGGEVGGAAASSLDALYGDDASCDE